MLGTGKLNYKYTIQSLNHFFSGVYHNDMSFQTNFNMTIESLNKFVSLPREIDEMIVLSDAFQSIYNHLYDLIIIIIVKIQMEQLSLKKLNTIVCKTGNVFCTKF